MSAQPTDEGLQLALVGMGAAEDAAGAWLDAWDSAIRYLARQPEPFTADDVREIAGAPADHPNAAGAVFLRLAREGVIRKVGFRPSRRAVLHAHNVALWVGA